KMTESRVRVCLVAKADHISVHLARFPRARGNENSTAPLDLTEIEGFYGALCEVAIAASQSVLAAWQSH
ncbi:MAG: hypothetical protein OXN84_14360, partial [Albidovulum sp.]|nr:hypothetical protein [Albidovulum sp.]